MYEERWTPVIIKHHGKDFEEGVFKKYEVSNMCIIRNTESKRVLSGKTERVGLIYNGVQKILRRHRICLASFYPDEMPIDISKYDVDHKDGNHNNNMLSNLQWICKSEHGKKTIVQTKLTRNSMVKKAGRKIKVIVVASGGNQDYLDYVFDSLTCASKKLNVDSGSISASAKYGYWVDNTYKFQYVDENFMEGEIFKPIGDYGISNKGRIKTKKGKVTVGSNMLGSKYRCVTIKLPGDIKSKRYIVHRLVWLAHKGPIPDGLVVMHDDTKHTLDKEGYERNWLQDLSLGTTQQNSQSYHNNRTDLKRVRCIDNEKEYLNAASAARDLGLKHSSIHYVCKKKIKTTGGYKFEYV